MRIHRSARTRYFTTLGNELLRDNRLSFCARGILAHLLSLPDGQRGDIRTLAERTPEGRERIASALRELERFGYLKRVVKRTAEGQLYTEVDVFDTSDGPSTLTTPNTGFPDSGAQADGPDGDHPEKERDEEPSLRRHPPPSRNPGGRPMAKPKRGQASACLRASHEPSRNSASGGARPSGWPPWWPSGGAEAPRICMSLAR